jgi:hypothetical protein
MKKEILIEELEENISELEIVIKQGVMDKDSKIYKVRNDLRRLVNQIEKEKN